LYLEQFAIRVSILLLKILLHRIVDIELFCCKVLFFCKYIPVRLVSFRVSYFRDYWPVIYACYIQRGAINGSLATVGQKDATIRWPITSSYIDRFSKLFHREN